MAHQIRTMGPNVTRFIEDHCTLNGSYAGKPFVPLPWMRKDINRLYQVDENNKRVVRTALLGVPRKSSKSTLGAALCAYHLIADTADDAPQVWGAAGDRDQAKIVFGFTKQIIEASPAMSAECKIFRDVIECTSNGGTYKVASADAGLAHGTNPSFTLFDEMHVQKNLDLYTALRTGSAQRNQPLTVIITTAGYNLDSPLGQFYRRGRRIANGEEIDPAFLMRWYGPDLGEKFDPYDETRWQEWMPSYEIMNLEEVRTAARELPPNEFIRFHLNGWTVSTHAWFRHGTWEGCEAETPQPFQDGDEIVVGFDGSYSGDCTGVVGCRLSDMHLQKLGVWERPENNNEWRVPVPDVMHTLRETHRKYKVHEFACDPFFWKGELENLANGTETAGGPVVHPPLPIVEVPTNVKAFSADIKIFRDAVLDKTLTHDGDRVLARHIANTTHKTGTYGEHKLAKAYGSSTAFIDLTVASILAVSRATLFKEEKPRQAQMIVI